jgi:hypothetical protein
VTAFEIEDIHLLDLMELLQRKHVQIVGMFEDKKYNNYFDIDNYHIGIDFEKIID